MFREEKSLRDRGYNVGLIHTANVSIKLAAHPDLCDEEFAEGVREAFDLWLNTVLTPR